MKLILGATVMFLSLLAMGVSLVGVGIGLLGLEGVVAFGASVLVGATAASVVGNQ